MPKESGEHKEKRVMVKVEEQEGPLEEAASNKEGAPEEKAPEQSQDSTGTPEPEAESAETPKEKAPSDKIPFWILFLSFVIGLSLGAGLIGGVFYYRSRVDQNGKPSPTPSATITPEDNTQASPSAEISDKKEFAKYKISILNGSGIKGEAGKVQDLLTTAGFTNTQTGNAQAYDYTETEISFKESVPGEIITEVKKALSTYMISEEKQTKEPSSDIQIIVGSKKSE